MRELELVEIGDVGGGPGPLVPLLVVGGVLGAAVIGVVAYAAYKNCDASAEITKEGIKIEVDCKPEPSGK